MNLAVEMAGLRLKNPVLTASGTFGYGVEFAAYGDLTALGGIVVKGLSWEPRKGNPMPRVAETPCGMLNAIGLQNIGVHRFVEEKLPLLPWAEVPVIANLYACDVTDFARLGEYLAEQEGVAALEVNISCPNVQAGGILFGQDPEQAARVTRAVKDRAGTKPVIVKLSPNVTDITTVAKAAADGGADILALINTLSGMAVDVRSRRPRLANVIGGLSGPAIKPVGLRCVYQVSRAVDLPIIGLGGIASAEDVLEYILVGAWAVQIGTANFLRPDMAFRIAADLPGLLDELGVTSWGEFRGALRA
ncbi:dihydroorotate dehydrogenase [Desulfonatronum thioautotrophicum]|uniref:dihydroorotate dehydrogenase n=1 Tax=Desulfonatronum thioautotrophicum TaxID=617001 RepID=UPI0005EB44C7|nr:dihydroorotate dehydrogenase [Desulfonatronum thioautotrophicum]